MEFCKRHLKRYERKVSICIGCHEEALAQIVNTLPANTVNEEPLVNTVSAPVSMSVSRREYMRQYMAKRRAKV